MPYKAGAEWKGNAKGRPTAEERVKKFTQRELRERELLMILRKIRPHVADSIIAAATIMKNKDAQDGNKLKAATILLDNYRKLVLDLYDGREDEEEGTEVQQENRPLFSLKVISEEDNKE
jgi:hypothetical protein